MWDDVVAGGVSKSFADPLSVPSSQCSFCQVQLAGNNSRKQGYKTT